MDFIDQLRALAARIPKQIDHIQTEEATKNALIMPFINMLGYNVFDPFEVVPEFTADVGTKKGEKVDYAILRDGEPIMLFECKWSGANLNEEHASQLYRYFSVTPARVGVLTNGVIYRFYSDLDEPNKMDERPFLEFNMLDIEEALVPELKRFSKSTFDIERTLSAATELKYTKAILQILAREWADPSDDLVRFFASQVYSGRMVQSVRDQFKIVVKRALHQYVNDQLNDRLKFALHGVEEDTEAATTVPVEEPTEPASEIETTEEEIEGFMIVKAIVREVVDLERVVMRDTKSYCGVLLDDNNRRPICRLRFNSASKKYLGVFDEDRNEEKIQIDNLNDIYNHADALKATVKRYLE